MKTRIPFVLLTLAILGISASSYPQARKYVMIEHFTQASCNPCAQQNPVLQVLLNTNRGSIHHIAYHTSWPGVDPMNAYNAVQVADRVTYYGVGGVPDCFMLGNQFHGGPASFTQSMINNAATDPAPIRVLVKETSDGTTRTVHVKVVTLDTIPTATYKIRVGVAEEWVNYATPPGSNGEKNFPDVFRKMIPNSAGDTYTPAAIGDTASFTYTYTLDKTHWDTTKIFSLAFIQNESTQEILNSGSSFDAGWELAPVSKPFVSGLPGDVKTFDYNLFNFKNTDDHFTVRVLSTQPNDWSTNFEINGTTYIDSVSILIPARSSVVMHVNMSLGDQPGLGNYAITMQSESDTSFDPQQLAAYIISQVHELVVNNDGSWGDNLSTHSVEEYQGIYLNALAYAGNTEYVAVTTIGALVKGGSNHALTGVWNYYFNISWTFPALTDASVACLKSELDAGKNLFISGQDIGWDVFTSSSDGGHSTQACMDFYHNYMNANWLNDGVASDNMLIANPSDSLYGNLQNSSLSQVYGASYFFPDEIKLRNAASGSEAFYYNTSHSKLGGVRATDGNWKVVYLAPAPEMIADTNVRKDIIKLAHDWFGSSTSGVAEFSDSKDELSQNVPNPAVSATSVTFTLSSPAPVSLKLYDINGKLIKNVVSGTFGTGKHSVNVSTSGLNAGIYYYTLQTNLSRLTKKMVVVK